MKTYFLQTQICLLLTLSIFVTSCNGQLKTNLLTDSSRTKQIIVERLLKIPKPRNVYQDATIDCGIQDKAGNIWFGSNGEGLYRYDGKTFTNFTTKDGLDNNIVYSILEDKTGDIWVGTKTGLNRYNGKTFTRITIILNYSLSFYPIQSHSNDPPLQNGVWCMMQDKSGKIWFGTDAGVYCYNKTYFSRFLDNQSIVNKDSLQLKAIFSILEDKTGSIWFGACIDEGISRFDGQSLINIVPQKAVGRVNRIVEDKNKNLWFSTSFNGVCRYDGKTFTKNIFKEKQGNQGNVLEDKAGNIWFDKTGGLGSYDGKTLKNFIENDELPNKNVFPILEDKSGNIWFSSYRMGLYRYDGKTFTNFSE
jgi:ligand-binding sensor domain-containing protein